MLSLTGVAVRFPGSDTAAVDGVTLTVAEHEILALLGPSGCGKSTLLRAIAGLEPLATGRITLDGADLARVPVSRRGFGLMFQDGVLFPIAPWRATWATACAGSAGARRARVAELLELVGLPGYQTRAVTELSGGQAQRVALARALAPRPRLLLLDEPLAALDRALRERLLDDLTRVLVATGTTAIFVTHDQQEAYAIADHVAVMRAGQLAQVGTPAQVWSAPADEWVARFVGYRTVVPLSAWRAAGGPPVAGAGPADDIALRPSALVVDSAGPLYGRCEQLHPDPDGTRLTVRVDGLGPLTAEGAGHAAAPGEPVRLAVVPAGLAVLRAKLPQ